MVLVDKTILFFDLVSSSKLWSQYEHDVYDVIKKIKNIISKKLEEYEEAQIIKMMGDGLMIVFKNILDSVNFSCYISDYLTDTKTSIYLKKEHINFRIGICFGQLYQHNISIQNYKQVDYYGNIVNIAARIQSNISPINGFAIAFIKNNDPYIDKIKNIIENRENFLIHGLNLKKHKYVDVNKVKKIYDLLFVDYDLEKLKGINTNMKILKITNLNLPYHKQSEFTKTFTGNKKKNISYNNKKKITKKKIKNLN
jgi:hypothetical protein